ncbi:hypothetical protein ACIA49_39200 [Kribbella sp. NPDC051587]|uniref:hypothetical protein n=1 Tax=Kribbella sp. NPDC051587 TaxID=3364119 RepID=UPI0037A7BA5B
MTCVYPTVLGRPCGRPAVRRIRWQEQHRTGPEIHDWPLCPFHHDLQLAELLLSCDVHALALLTLDGDLIQPTDPALLEQLWPISAPSAAELLQLVDPVTGKDTARARRIA